MKKLLTVTGLTLLALAGCQSGGEPVGDDVAPVDETVNEVVLPPVNEVPMGITEQAEVEEVVAPVVDDSAVSTEVEAN